MATTHDDEDILAVTESLAADLAATEEEATEEAPAEEEAASEEEAPEAVEEASEEEAPEEAAEEAAEEAPVEEEAPAEEEEEAKAEGQEEPHKDDDKPPKNRESVEDEIVTETEEVGSADLSEAEERIVALEATVTKISEENAKLRLALKRDLAERVVDAKISLGLVEKDQREALVTEHLDRSASSLADSLRDFAAMAPVTRSAEGAPIVEPTVGAVSGEGEKVITNESEEEDTSTDPEEMFIESMTDVFMGRRNVNS